MKTYWRVNSSWCSQRSKVIFCFRSFNCKKLFSQYISTTYLRVPSVFFLCFRWIVTIKRNASSDNHPVTISTCVLHMYGCPFDYPIANPRAIQEGVRWRWISYTNHWTHLSTWLNPRLRRNNVRSRLDNKGRICTLRMSTGSQDKLDVSKSNQVDGSAFHTSLFTIGVKGLLNTPHWHCKTCSMRRYLCLPLKSFVPSSLPGSFLSKLASVLVITEVQVLGHADGLWSQYNRRMLRKQLYQMIFFTQHGFGFM